MTHTTVSTTTTSTASATRVPWVAWLAIVGGALLLLMAALVIGSEDELPDAPLVTLYFAGMALALTAAVGAGLRMRGGLARRVAIGVALAVATLLFIMSGITEPVFAAMSDAEWVEDEGPIGLLGAIFILLGVRAATRQRG